MIRIAIDPDEKFSPEVLNELSAGIRDVRSVALLSIDGAGADEAAEQHYLVALSLLEQAERSLHLASLYQSRALAVVQRS